ncbi:excinuclease ABC subunit UvrC [Candidatus Kapabacteria bacterium]|nr:excinuclease ABC subunit UvrC [Candidatus Kapabacteria bacterium]
MDLNEKISRLPQKPGCYQFKNSNDKIIYVGKAIKLKNRVKSYFQENRPRDAKTKALIQHIRDLEVLVTDTEAEALILEDTLIKKHKPKYNILLRDDKTYPFIKITKEKYPKVYTTRNKIKDGSKYIGPITEVYNLKNIMKAIGTLFKIRTCDLDITSKSIEQQKHKVCLEYHINKCEGPCQGFVSEEKYGEGIRKSIKVLEGKTLDVERQFEKDMLAESEVMNFEKATKLRNNLKLLREFTSKQKIVSNDDIDRDIFGLSRIDDEACSIVLKIRDGKLIGKRHFIIKNALRDTDSSLIQRTVERWYIESGFIPDEILLTSEPTNVEYLSSYLSEIKEKSIKILIPKIGDKRKFIEMAETNAKYILKEHQLALIKREQTIPRVILSLQRDLRLKKPPKIIECFDNSHFQGTDLVSSLVHFEDGKPKKSEYKRFKNKTVLKNDDFAAMREAVLRRYTRLKEDIENAKSNNLDKIPSYPDLLIIDGGKGQLSAAMESLQKIGLENQFVICGMAKRLEELFFPNDKESLILPKTSSSLRLLQQVRDEAHRFAITYHRTLRDKRTFQTELTEIKGIGENTAKALLKNLGSVSYIKTASDKELNKYLNKSQLNSLKKHFNL